MIRTPAAARLTVAFQASTLPLGQPSEEEKGIEPSNPLTRVCGFRDRCITTLPLFRRYDGLRSRTRVSLVLITDDAVSVDVPGVEPGSYASAAILLRA